MRARFASGSSRSVAGSAAPREGVETAGFTGVAKMGSALASASVIVMGLPRTAPALSMSGKSLCSTPRV